MAIDPYWLKECEEETIAAAKFLGIKEEAVDDEALREYRYWTQEER